VTSRNPDSGGARRLIDSPLGGLCAHAREGGIRALKLRDTHDCSGSYGTDSAEAHSILDRLERELDMYFAGRLERFSVPVELPAEMPGFSRAVLIETMSIPYGKVRTYGDLAASIGAPRATQATGSALRRNPLLILVPCHRVIPLRGGIGGYAAGIGAKEILLRLEGSI
jgi:O-6-methylguanine DNA methyltransferase